MSGILQLSQQEINTVKSFMYSGFVIDINNKISPQTPKHTLGPALTFVNKSCLHPLPVFSTLPFDSRRRLISNA